MATKIIPFDLDTAKKIQAGEIEGKIKTRGGEIVNDFHLFRTKRAYCLYASIGGVEVIHSYTADGYERKWDKSNCWDDDIVLEVPGNEPQFKPFDKVLVRNNENTPWKCDMFSLYYNNSENCYWCIGGVYRYCIPYAGNEHLVGATDKPKED